MTIRRVETPTARPLPSSDQGLEVKKVSAEELKKSLSPDQAKSLDVNGDGQLTKPEAEAALAAADINSDNFVDKSELSQFAKLLRNGAAVGAGLGSDFVQSGLGSRARSADGDAQTLLQDATARLAAETAKLGSVPVPTESSQVIAGRANALREKLPDLPPALDRAKAEVAQAKGTLSKFDADTAKLQTKVNRELKQLSVPAELDKASQMLQSKVGIRQETIKQLQAQLATTPAPSQGLSGSERESAQERLTYLEGVVSGQSADKRFVDNARKEISQLQAKLNPPNAQGNLQKRIGELQREVEGLKELKTNVETLRAAPAVRAKYAAPIPGAEAKVGQLEKELSQTKAEYATLQAQLPVAEAREALVPVQLRAGASSRLASTASAGEAAVAQGNKTLDQVRTRVGDARDELEVVKSKGFGTLKDTLQKTRWLEQEVNGGRIDRDDINMQWVNWSNQVIGEHVGRHFEQLEGQSKKLIKDFENPEFRAAVNRLPQAERAALLKDFASVLSETKAGRAYLDGPLARQQQAVYSGQGSATDREFLGGENGNTLYSARSRNYSTDYESWQKARFSPDSAQAKAIENEFQSGRVTAGKVLSEVPGVIADAAVALKDTGAAAIQFLKDVEEGLDYEKNIKALGDGDSYELKLGLKAAVEAQAGGEVTVKVKKEDGKYKLDLSGDVEVGLNAFNTGVQAGPAKAGWNAEVNAKGGVTLGTEFNTAEEAIAFLKKSAAFSDLKKYATSVELHGGIAAQVEGGLGLGDKKKALLGAYGSAGVELQTKVAINFKNPPELVVGYQVEGTANAGVGAFEFGDAGKKGGKLGMLAGGEVKGTIELSTTYKLPNIDSQKLRNEPLTVLGSAGKQMMDSAETELKATLLGQGAVAGDGGGLKAEASFKGPTKDITSANVAVMADLARGRFSDAARELSTVSKKIEVKASVSPYVTRGVDLQASAAFLGVGIGGKLKGLRTDVQDPLWKFQGTLDQAAVKLGENAVKTAEVLRPTALPIRY